VIKEHRIIYVDSTVFCRGSSLSTRHVRSTRRTKHRTGPGRPTSRSRHRPTGKRRKEITNIIINEKISVAFSPKTARTRNTKKDDMFGRQRTKQEDQQRHQYEVANKYITN